MFARLQAEPLGPGNKNASVRVMTEFLPCYGISVCFQFEVTNA